MHSCEIFGIDCGIVLNYEDYSPHLLDSSQSSPLCVSDVDISRRPSGIALRIAKMFGGQQGAGFE